MGSTGVDASHLLKLNSKALLRRLTMRALRGLEELAGRYFADNRQRPDDIQLVAVMASQIDHGVFGLPALTD